MTDSNGKCGATREGHKFASGVVMWRTTCKSWPLKGYEHCRYHLTLDEYERYHERKNPVGPS